MAKLDKNYIKKLVQEEMEKGTNALDDLLYQVDKINDLTLLVRQKIENVMSGTHENKNKLVFDIEFDLKKIQELSNSLDDFGMAALEPVKGKLQESGMKDAVIGTLLTVLTIGGAQMYKLNDALNNNKKVVQKVYGSVIDKMGDEEIRGLADRINDNDPTFQNKMSYDELRPKIQDYVIKNSDEFAMNKNGTKLEIIK